MGQGAAQHQRAAAVDVLLELLGAEDQSTPRPAQGLVGRRRHDVGVRDRVELALEHLAGDQAGEVGHVDHQDRADAVGDLAHPGVVDVPRVGAEAGQQDQRLDLDGLLLDGVVVEQERLAIDGVAVRLEHLARRIEPVAVGEVAARGEIQAQQPLIAQRLADLVPLVGRQLVPVGGNECVRALGPQDLGHLGELDPAAQDGPEGHEVGIGAAVRLGIGVLRRRRARAPAGSPGPRSSRRCRSRHRTGDAGSPRRTCRSAGWPWRTGSPATSSSRWRSA